MAFFNPLTGPDVYVRPPHTHGEAPAGTGAKANPFNTVRAGILKAAGGGTVHVRVGRYVEHVHVTGISGRWWRRIRVVPWIEPGDDAEQVVIDAILPEFLTPGGRWLPIPEDQGVDGEFYWSTTFPGGEESGRVNAGAFLDWPRPDEARHTRLVTYDRVEDLRATNETWPENPATGANRVWRANETPPHTFSPVPLDSTKFARYRDWVYMGPGIWFDVDTRDPDNGDIGGRLLHIRLAPTHNNVDEWDDYDGETDPNRLPLALSLQDTHALLLKDCKHIRLQGLTLRFGNPDTVRLTNCTNIVLDHVRISSAGRGIRIQTDGAEGKTALIVVSHSEVDGGLPTWFFRSDRKDGYTFGPDQPAGVLPETSELLHANMLGQATSGSLISGGARTSTVTIHHCEITNGHDSYVFGDSMQFHHNYVHNLNDDSIALAPDQAKAKNAKIYCNVVTQCLTAVSFAHGPVEQVWLYGNLIDIRSPTLGRRPTGDGPPDSLRQGHFFKDGFGEGPIDLFHNTIVVLDPGAKGDVDLDELTRAGFAYYSAIGDSLPRNSFNNIVVAAYTTTSGTRPVAFLPPASFPCQTNGNTYYRISPGAGNPINFIVRRTFAPPDPPPPENEDFVNLDKYRNRYWPPASGQTPQEEDGLLENPLFNSFDTENGRPSRHDDLRLRRKTPADPERGAKGAAVEMPKLLRNMYRQATGTVSTDRGCYPANGPLLQVGVGGRKRFPPRPPLPEPDTHGVDPLSDPLAPRDGP